MRLEIINGENMVRCGEQTWCLGEFIRGFYDDHPNDWFLHFNHPLKIEILSVGGIVFSPSTGRCYLYHQGEQVLSGTYTSVKDCLILKVEQIEED